jgi:5-hydroxyisourate hydrolase
VSQDRPTISTHVLDTAAGVPRAGVPVRLRRVAANGAGPIVGEGVTDADGRVRDLLGGGILEPGAYRLEFALDPDGFYTGVALDLRVRDAGRSYHVPLLLAPFGLTTYRGS